MNLEDQLSIKFKAKRQIYEKISIATRIEVDSYVFRKFIIPL